MITSQPNDQLEIQMIQMATTPPLEQIITSPFPCLRKYLDLVFATGEKTENRVKTLHSSLVNKPW